MKMNEKMQLACENGDLAKVRTMVDDSHRYSLTSMIISC